MPKVNPKFEKFVNMSKEEIEEYLKDFKPYFESKRHKYFVNINGIMFPIVQVVALVCGLSPLEISSGQAYSLMKKKGFEIIERGKEEE